MTQAGNGSGMRDVIEKKPKAAPVHGEKREKKGKGEKRLRTPKQCGEGVAQSLPNATGEKEEAIYWRRNSTNKNSSTNRKGSGLVACARGSPSPKNRKKKRGQQVKPNSDREGKERDEKKAQASRWRRETPRGTNLRSRWGGSTHPIWPSYSQRKRPNVQKHET